MFPLPDSYASFKIKRLLNFRSRRISVQSLQTQFPNFIGAEAEPPPRRPLRRQRGDDPPLGRGARRPQPDLRRRRGRPQYRSSRRRLSARDDLDLGDGGLPTLSAGPATSCRRSLRGLRLFTTAGAVGRGRIHLRCRDQRRAGVFRGAEPRSPRHPRISPSKRSRRSNRRLSVTGASSLCSRSTSTRAERRWSKSVFDCSGSNQMPRQIPSPKSRR